MTAKAWYDIEAGYDYLYAQYSLDNGANWTTIGSPLDGSSNGRWSGLRYSYKANGQPSQFRFLYKTDGGYNLAGAFLDSITVGSFTDGAENGDNGWTADGWTISTGTDVSDAPRYYLIENRQYVGYDKTLAEGPYQYSFGITAPNKVEWFPYQDGMLVWLVDRAYLDDNNVSQHPGAGYALPVDASPNSLTYPDGTSPTNRREPYDATFGLDDQDDPSASARRWPAGPRRTPRSRSSRRVVPPGPSRRRSTTPTPTPTTTLRLRRTPSRWQGSASRRPSRPTTASSSPSRCRTPPPSPRRELTARTAPPQHRRGPATAGPLRHSRTTGMRPPHPVMRTRR